MLITDIIFCKLMHLFIHDALRLRPGIRQLQRITLGHKAGQILRLVRFHIVRTIWLH